MLQQSPLTEQIALTGRQLGFGVSVGPGVAATAVGGAADVNTKSGPPQPPDPTATSQAKKQKARAATIFILRVYRVFGLNGRSLAALPS